MQVCDIMPELQVSLIAVNALVQQLDCTSCSSLCKDFFIFKERLVTQSNKMLSFVGSYLVFFFVQYVVCVSLSHLW